MEYVFGSARRNGHVYEAVKTKGEAHSNLEGVVQIKRQYDDSVIYDKFKVIEKFRSKKDEEGNCYDWYTISDHYRYEDKYTPNIGKVEQKISETIDGLMETYDLSAGNADDIADLRTAIEEVYEMLSE